MNPEHPFQDTWSDLPPEPPKEPPRAAFSNNPQPQFVLTDRKKTQGYQPAAGNPKSSDNLAGDPATIAKRLRALREKTDGSTKSTASDTERWS